MLENVRWIRAYNSFCRIHVCFIYIKPLAFGTLILVYWFQVCYYLIKFGQKPDLKIFSLKDEMYRFNFWLSILSAYIWACYPVTISPSNTKESILPLCDEFQKHKTGRSLKFLRSGWLHTTRTSELNVLLFEIS